MASRRVALSGNASLIATFCTYVYCEEYLIKYFFETRCCWHGDAMPLCQHLSDVSTTSNISGFSDHFFWRWDSAIRVILQDYSALARNETIQNTMSRWFRSGRQRIVPGLLHQNQNCLEKIDIGYERIWLLNTCVKFHIKTPSRCCENWKNARGILFKPHPVEPTFGGFYACFVCK